MRIFNLLACAALIAAPATAADMSWTFCNEQGCLQTRITEDEAVATRQTVLTDREVARARLHDPDLTDEQNALVFDMFIASVSIELQTMLFPDGKPVTVADHEFEFPGNEN